MWASLFAMLSPEGRAARLSILIFHRVLPGPDALFPDEPDAERFEEICRWLANWFRVLDLDDALVRLRQNQLPARAAAITFDDGYADNHDIALPILQRHRLTATFFVATNYLDGGRMWNDGIIEALRRTSHKTLSLRGLLPAGHDSTPIALPTATVPQRRAAIDTLINRVKYLPHAQREAIVQDLAQRLDVGLSKDLMMASDQVVAMRRAGMGIGAHTCSHPILARLDGKDVRREMADSRDALQALLRERVGLFAYPNGRPGTDYNLANAVAARDVGFDFAVNTAWGAATARSDPYQLPRFTPWDRSKYRFGARLATNLWNSPR